MSNISQSQANLVTAASAGVDVLDFTTDGAGPFTPPAGSRGWKFMTVSTEAVLGSLTETGGNPDSTGIVGPTLGAGTLLSANGLFTSIGLGSGCIIALRG